MYIGILLWVQVCHMGRQRSGEVRVGQALLSCLSYVPAGTSAARQLPTLLRSLLQINLKLPEDGCMAPRGKARFFDRLTSLDWKVILALVLWTGDCNRQATQGGTFTDARRDGKLSERWLLLIVFFLIIAFNWHTLGDIWRSSSISATSTIATHSQETSRRQVKQLKASSNVQGIMTVTNTQKLALKGPLTLACDNATYEAIRFSMFSDCIPACRALMPPGLFQGVIDDLGSFLSKAQAQ